MKWLLCKVSKNCPLPEKLISNHKFGLSLNLTAMLIVDLQVHVLTVTHL